MSVEASRARFDRRRWAAPGGTHDRVVATLGTALPIGIGVLAAFLVMAPVLMGGDVSFVLDKNKVEVARERMRIQQASYRGDDSRGRAFTLTAGSAVQKNSAEPIVRIDRLAAGLELDDGPARLTAPGGRYDMDRQQVQVAGPIRFTAADGYTLATRDATLDLRTRRLASGGAVDGQVPVGRFSADRLRADLNARVVTLDGNARLRIEPRRAKGR